MNRSTTIYHEAPTDEFDPKHTTQSTNISCSCPRQPDVSCPQGILGHRSRLPFFDVCLVAFEVLCVIVAVLTVFLPSVAILLGEVRQLIVVGFLLAVMGLCTESVVMRTIIVHLGLWSRAAIQDIDAALRKDLFAHKAHLSIRLIILGLMILPLALSAAYKGFIGGSTKVTIDYGAGFFGFSSIPGHQRIGNGLSLVSELYVPFWIDPAVDRTYGYNLYIPDNETAVIVDSPFPEYLTSLQHDLVSNQTIVLSATVNATVSELQNPTTDQRANETYLGVLFDDNDPSFAGGVLGSWTGLLWGKQGGSNFTEGFFASYNSTRNESFTSNFNRVVQTRRMAHAEWLITESSITLISASLVEDSVTDDQSLIQGNFLGLQTMFLSLLDEYQVAERDGAFDQPYPGPVGALPRYHLPVNTIPALAASIIWSRITSLDTIDRPLGIQDPHLRTLTGYYKQSQDVITTKYVPSLKRSPLLLLILVIHPMLSIACVLFKASCHQSPLGDGFNVTALLAAARNSRLGILEGAALTGKLNSKVRVRFSNHAATSEHVDYVGQNDIRLVLYTEKERDEVGLLHDEE